MRLEASQLAAAAQRKLAPVYLVAGDEILLVDEACAAIRNRAAAEGYERRVHTVEAGFDWNDFFAEVYSPSLFAPRSLHELRVTNAKPGDSGGKILLQIAENPPAQTILLVIAGKLDKTAQQTKWVTALEAAGVAVMVRPLDAAQWPAWIQARLQARGVVATADAVAQLAYHLEGNALAAAQEIDKLALLYGAQRVEAADVIADLSDDSRFTVFAWVDACVAGDAADAMRKLERLLREGTEPVLCLWALTRELRTLTSMARALSLGEREAQVLQNFGVWTQRKPLVTKALKRLRYAQWQRLVRELAQGERIAKGRAAGDIAFELERLTLAVCGVRSASSLFTAPLA